MASLAITLFFLGACANDKEPDVCKPGLTNLAPTKARSYNVNAGQITRFHAEPRACNEGANYNIRWRLNNEIVSYSNDYDFIACNEDAGVHELYAEAITYAATNTASVEKVVAAHKWAINVIDVSKPETPSCYAQSIRDIQNVKASSNVDDAKKLTAAVSCLEPYLKTYACDFKASYATGLAKAALFAETLYPFYLARADKTVADVKAMVEQQINPIRQNFSVVAAKAPEDFSFTVDGRFKVYAFRDDPNLRGDDTIYFEGYGRHDKTEAAALMTMMNFFDAFLSIGLANQGIVDFVMHTPDNETPTSGAERLVTAMEQDPRFLTFIDGYDANGALLNDGSGTEGRRLMGLAQNYLVNGFKESSALFTRIMAETHDQTNDPIRYWDCGKDAICPATCPYMGAVYFNPDRLPDQPEYRNHGSCEKAGDSFDDDNYNNKCDEGWSKADAGECNGKYDDGEQIGTTRVAFGDVPTRRISPQINISVLQAVFKIMRDNIRGPDHLDLDKIAEVAGLGAGNFVTLGLQGLLLPYPMIRLSEFFVTPTQFRGLVPLYDKTTKQFIISLESEPFEDTGYDGLYSYQEHGYNRHTNPDPNRDDLDVYCNPFCNENDVIPFDPSDPFVGTPVDNDGDGLANGADNGFIEDMGVEGNLTFDFIDRQPHNKKHDVGEVSEPFKDIGTVNSRGATVGAGNKVWDKADRAHEAPTGSNIGPVSDLVLKDPFNGLLLEQPDGLYDFYYYFFQDPTFSGVVKMVADPRKLGEKITNANGEVLTDNALIHRFMNRGLQLADEVKIWEANAHPCSEADYSKCNHWDPNNPSAGYQP